eukprot:gene13502-1257_t
MCFRRVLRPSHQALLPGVALLSLLSIVVIFNNTAKEGGGGTSGTALNLDTLPEDEIRGSNALATAGDMVGDPTGDTEEAAHDVEAAIRDLLHKQPPVILSAKNSLVAPVVDKPRRAPSTATVPTTSTIPGPTDASQILRHGCHHSELKEEGLTHAKNIRQAYSTFKAKELEDKKMRTYCIARCAGREVTKKNAGKQLVIAPKAWLPTEGLRCCDGATRSAADAIVLSEGKDVHDDGTSDITLVTQGTSNRISAVTDQLNHWEGPVVAVFSINNYTDELADQANEQFRDIEEACKKWNRSNLRVLVLALDFPAGKDYISKMMREGSPLGLYPVNAMRNLALDQSQTNWVFPVDMDFIPCGTLYKSMKSVYLEKLSQINRPAVVVPHFEIPNCKTRPLPLPRTYAELMAMTISELAMPFHVKASRVMSGLRSVDGFPSRSLHFRETADSKKEVYRTADCYRPTSRSWAWGILATNYSRWYYESKDSVGMFRIPVPWTPKDPGNVASLPKRLRGTPCPTDRATGIAIPRPAGAPKCGRVSFLSAESWEPFVMFRKVELDTEPKAPRYSEKYIGRFKNKVEFVTKLRAHRYKFYTMHGEFIVHKPHPVSKATSQDQIIMKDLMIELHEREARRLTEELRDMPLPKPSRYEGGFRCSYDELGWEQPKPRFGYGYRHGGHSDML